jgi:hypothetical protein
VVIFDRAFRRRTLALEMDEQLLTIIARHPTARRLDELISRESPDLAADR